MKALHTLLLAACLAPGAALAAPALDLAIRYYSRVVTDEGVTRESRYEERMLRRPGHVWVERVLPAAPAAPESGHQHFNPVRLARHVTLQGGQLKLEYVDRRGRERVAIPPAEYANVAFNGSWEGSYHLVPPQAVAAMPLAARASEVPGARWHEREQDGRFQRVLWDEARQVALVIELGNRAGTDFQRIEARPLQAAGALPWSGLAGFSQKEYADFLD